MPRAGNGQCKRHRGKRAKLGSTASRPVWPEWSEVEKEKRSSEVRGPRQDHGQPCSPLSGRWLLP